MSRRLGCAAALLAACALVSLSSRVRAEPYLAVMEGYKCNVCHVNPTGGGLRNQFGTLYSKSLLAVRSDDPLSAWSGALGDAVRVGGNLRAAWSTSLQPNTARQEQFALEQMRVYADVTVIPERLGLYVDEQVAPNAALNLEAYVRYGSTSGFYAKGGQFYLPFGWRLQDQTAFVRELSGISMITSQQGVEIGYERVAWSSQLDYDGIPSSGSVRTGHQISGQTVFVQALWRLGAAVSLTQSDAGNRRVGGLFAGTRSGPVAWLGEVDMVRDQSLPGGRRLAAGLLEADWRVRRGHNLKFTAEYRDPNRAIREDQQVRYSAIYEYTPVPFLQLRAGFRRYRGIPQSNVENQRLAFLELHGYF